jgi:CheY-like chemotaxis protein
MTWLNKTIAWIEDDAEVLSEVVKPLVDIGCKIVPYETAKKARESIDKIRKADLILLDTFFPTGDYPAVGKGLENEYTGIHLAQDLRRLYRIRIPIVIFSVVHEDEVSALLENLGIDDIIPKPVRPSILKERLLRFLE